MSIDQTIRIIEEQLCYLYYDCTGSDFDCGQFVALRDIKQKILETRKIEEELARPEKGESKMSEIILEREPVNCPFRMNTVFGQKCEIVFNRNECQACQNAYPIWCPILNHDVVVRAARKVEEC